MDPTANGAGYPFDGACAGVCRGAFRMAIGLVGDEHPATRRGKHSKSVCKRYAPDGMVFKRAGCAIRESSGMMFDSGNANDTYTRGHGAGLIRDSRPHAVASASARVRSTRTSNFISLRPSPFMQGEHGAHAIQLSRSLTWQRRCRIALSPSYHCRGKEHIGSAPLAMSMPPSLAPARAKREVSRPAKYADAATDDNRKQVRLISRHFSLLPPKTEVTCVDLILKNGGKA
jgi:hypothetical protein